MAASPSAVRSGSSKGSSPACRNSSASPPSRRTPLSPEAKASTQDSRTIILAPTGKDALLIAGLLERCAIPCHAAASIDELCLELARGAGAAIISEEALPSTAIAALRELIERQPPWSDFPLILLTVGGRVTVESERLRELRSPLGNIFLLERPIRPETLLSTLEIALRGRQRQYQIRDQMQQYARAQDALRRSEKLAVTGRLAASIAHEINNPLEAVTNLFYLMRSNPAPHEMRKYMDDAEQELARVAEITRQTLRFYREPSHPVDTDVVGVLRSVLVLYNSRLTSAGVAVQLEVDAENATVLASPGELRQVIANIIGNAIDAMRHGGRLRVRMSGEAQPAGAPRLRLTIADSGSGIPAALLPAIFEPFVTTKGETGTGLGLWVTGEIIRRNRWNIRVRSRCGADHPGTAFSITMPLRSAMDRRHVEPAAAVA
jgi:signal transduction histidine kinase